MELKLSSKTMKGQSGVGFSSIIWGVVFAVIAFTVLGLTVTYTSDIQEDHHEDVCPTGDTYVTAATPFTNSSAVNPVTSGNWGCCQTTGSTTRNCTAWRTDNHAVNVSFEGMDAQFTIAEGQDSMANVIIAAAIISLLIGAFGGLAYYGSKR